MRLALCLLCYFTTFHTSDAECFIQHLDFMKWFESNEEVGQDNARDAHVESWLDADCHDKIFPVCSSFFNQMTEHCWITVSIHATLRRAPASILDSKVDSTNFMGFRIPSRKIHKCPTAAQRRKLARPSYYTVHNLPLFRNSHN